MPKEMKGRSKVISVRSTPYRRYNTRQQDKVQKIVQGWLAIAQDEELKAAINRLKKTSFLVCMTHDTINVIEGALLEDPKTATLLIEQCLRHEPEVNIRQKKKGKGANGSPQEAKDQISDDFEGSFGDGIESNEHTAAINKIIDITSKLSDEQQRKIDGIMARLEAQAAAYEQKFTFLDLTEGFSYKPQQEFGRGSKTTYDAVTEEKRPNTMLNSTMANDQGSKKYFFDKE